MQQANEQEQHQQQQRQHLPRLQQQRSPHVCRVPPQRCMSLTTLLAVCVALIACARKRQRSNEEEDDLRPARRRNNVQRGLLRSAVTAELGQLPDPFFNRMFRMPLTLFKWLVHATTPHFRMRWSEKSSMMAVLSSGSEVQRCVYCMCPAMYCP